MNEKTKRIVFVDLKFSATVMNAFMRNLLPFSEKVSISRQCLGHLRRIIDRIYLLFEHFLTRKTYHTKFTGADMSQLKNFSIIGTVHVSVTIA